MSMIDERENQSCCADTQEDSVCHENQELQSCREELQALKGRYAYLSSDLENIRRRAEQDRLNYIRQEQMRILRNMLPIMDDLERALEQISLQQGDGIDQIFEGISLVQRNFAKILEQYGVVGMKDVTQFDPHLHEAVMQVEQEGAVSGTIVAVLQKGYLLRGELLRPAQVSVVA